MDDDDKDAVITILNEIKSDKTVYIIDKNERQIFHNHLTFLYLTFHKIIKANQMFCRIQNKVNEMLITKDYLSIENDLQEIEEELKKAIEKIDKAQHEIRKIPIPYVNYDDGALSWRLIE